MSANMYVPMLCMYIHAYAYPCVFGGVCMRMSVDIKLWSRVYAETLTL